MSNSLSYYPEAHRSLIGAALGRAFAFLARAMLTLLIVILLCLAIVAAICGACMYFGVVPTFAVLAAGVAVSLFALALWLLDKL
jgi:hypothetical protein